MYIKISPRWFNQRFVEVIPWLLRNELIDMAFTIEQFLEVAIESWNEWDNKPPTTEFRSDALTEWAIRAWVQPALSARFVQLLQLTKDEIVGSECELNSCPDSSVGRRVWTEFSGREFKSHDLNYSYF